MVTNEETVEKVEQLLSVTLKELTGISLALEAVKESQIIMARSHEIIAMAAKALATTFERILKVIESDNERS